MTGLTGLTRLGNESLLSDKIILTQRGKGAEEDVVSNLNNHTFKHSNIQTFERRVCRVRFCGEVKKKTAPGLYKYIRIIPVPQMV